MFDVARIHNETGVSSLPSAVVPIDFRSIYTVHRTGIGETAAEIRYGFEGGCPEAAAVTGSKMPYTHVIRRDGRIEQALPWTEVGPHAYAWNTRSASVGVVGDFRDHEPTAEQWDSLVWLCTVAALVVGGADGVYGHDELGDGRRDKSKACPGPRLEMRLLRAQVRERILRLCADGGMVW